MLRLVLAFGLLAIASAGLAEQSHLRVATLNAEWLWTPHDNAVDGSRFNKGDPSVTDYEKELQFYKSQIEKNSIDVLAISEIENEQVAKELAIAFGNGWRYAFRQGRDTATGQDVAILYRVGDKAEVTDFDFPAGEVKGYKPKRLSKVVGLNLHFEGRNIGFITCHFLSKRNESPKKAAKRLMQARGLVKAVQQYAASDVLFVLGDFNDYRASPVLKTLEKDAGLTNALQGCQQDVSPGQARYLIDHILYRGLECSSMRLIKTEDFSDHPMVIAEFVL